MSTLSLKEYINYCLNVPTIYGLQWLLLTVYWSQPWISVFSNLCKCWGGSLPHALNFMKGLRKVIDFQFVQFLSCENGSDDFQVLCMLRLKPKVLIVLYFYESLLKFTCSIIHSFGTKLYVLTNAKNNLAITTVKIENSSLTNKITLCCSVLPVSLHFPTSDNYWYVLELSF